MKSTIAMSSPYFALLLCLVTAVALASLWPIAAAAQETEEAPARVKVPSSNPLSGDPEAIDAGAKLYFKFCVSCHGIKYDGVSRFGAYAGDLTKFWRGTGEFLAIVTNGRPKKGMPPWGEYLDPLQMYNIGAFLETQAVEGANWK